MKNLRIVTAKGNEKWVIASGRPLLEGERTVGLIGTLQDVDHQVKSALKTKENEQLLKTLIDNLPINVYIKDIESRKILVNRAECDFAGVDSPDKILGKNDFDIYDKKTARAFRDEDLEVLRTLKTHSRKREHLHGQRWFPDLDFNFQNSPN